jgi:hypothetical protein
MKSKIVITVRMLDAKGTCKTVTVDRVVKPYGSGEHFVSYRGHMVFVKKFNGCSKWFGSTANYWG